VDQARQHRAKMAQAEDEREQLEQAEAEVVEQSVNVSNESLTVLRERLFTNKEESSPDSSTERVLQHHRMLQDDLSDAMLGMARGLKERSIAFGDALKEDSKVLVRSRHSNCTAR
jgi:hypothetical protein